MLGIRHGTRTRWYITETIDLLSKTNDELSGCILEHDTPHKKIPAKILFVNNYTNIEATIMHEDNEYVLTISEKLKSIIVNQGMKIFGTPGFGYQEIYYMNKTQSEQVRERLKYWQSMENGNQ